MNRGILLLLVISGGIRVETESRYYSLKEKDVLLINGNELFEVQGSPSNAILVLTITDRFSWIRSIRSIVRAVSPVTPQKSTWAAKS